MIENPNRTSLAPRLARVSQSAQIQLEVEKLQLKMRYRVDDSYAEFLIRSNGLLDPPCSTLENIYFEKGGHRFLLEYFLPAISGAKRTSAMTTLSSMSEAMNQGRMDPLDLVIGVGSGSALLFYLSHDSSPAKVKVVYLDQIGLNQDFPYKQVETVLAESFEQFIESLHIEFAPSHIYWNSGKSSGSAEERLKILSTWINEYQERGEFSSNDSEYSDSTLYCNYLEEIEMLKDAGISL